MAYFVQIKPGEESFKRCLDAINYLGRKSGELWLDSFNEKAEEDHSLPNMNVLVHWWQYLAETKVSWEYEQVYAQRASYEYHRYDGLHLSIVEDRNRVSHVIKSDGIRTDLLERLEGLDSIRLNEELDRSVKRLYRGEGIELRLSDYVN